MMMGEMGEGIGGDSDGDFSGEPLDYFLLFVFKSNFFIFEERVYE